MHDGSFANNAGNASSKVLVSFDIRPRTEARLDMVRSPAPQHHCHLLLLF